MSTPRTRLNRERIIFELRMCWPSWDVEGSPLQRLRYERLRGELARCERVLAKLPSVPVALWGPSSIGKSSAVTNAKLILDVAGDMDALIRGFREEWE